MADSDTRVSRLHATPLFREADIQAARRIVAGVFGDDTDMYDHYLQHRMYSELSSYLRAALGQVSEATAAHPDVVATGRLLEQVETAIGRC